MFALAHTLYKLEQAQAAGGGSEFFSRVCEAEREFYCNLSIDSSAPAAELSVPLDVDIL